ncbi:unnamed protein product [Rotaria sp. Silwood2]|nr:unnamed protein product [Rotaria sp. Silwood2]CAF2790692.1 unnamed protein product [Rotaria sp. Silwood2]CAF3023877.1 unnamed protein product [Rotaria sp. Silwood2]CAF3862093.1 unnamed protein product [Rotaria sp. Silwood2]CAF3927765.1 unnamed protein product [Rotaria sp. Silwood2]
MMKNLLIIIVSLLLIIDNFGLSTTALFFSSWKPKNLGPIRDGPPSAPNDYGRYKKPFYVIDFSWVSPLLVDFFSLKNWDFKSISTPTYFIGVSIVNLNYEANAFLYVIDRTNANQIYKYSSKSILAIAIKEKAKSSINGCTHYRQSDTEYIRLCYNSVEKVFHIEAVVPINGGIHLSLNCKMQFFQDTDDSMVLLYPIRQYRPAYTHKIAARPVKGTLKIDNQNEQLIDGLGSGDWTLGFFEHTTTWKWASLSTNGIDSANNQPIRIGISLSVELYDDENGISMENAIWIDNRVYIVDKVIFQLPSQQFQTSQPWNFDSSVDTTNSPILHLIFHPWGSYEEHDYLLLIAIDFVQPYGTYSGTIEWLGHTYKIDNGVGVTETNSATW